MDPRHGLAGAALGLAFVVFSNGAIAGGSGCGRTVTRASVVPCALGASLAVRGEQHGVEAARGRERAAGVMLPQSPVLSVRAGWPTARAAKRELNWSGSLAQEIEIGGQRGARVEVARAEVEGQSRRVVLSERQAAAAALVAYFEALAARDALALAGRMAEVGAGLSASATTRADQGLASVVDADVAYAASMKLVQARAAADRRAAAAIAALSGMVGIDPAKGAVAVEGDLVPLGIAEGDVARLADQAAAGRAEIEIARAEASAQDRRAGLLRRSRVPNLTLSFFVENDSLNERVVGGGISLPIPLPGPVGRTNAGEIAEANALGRRAEAEADRLAREARVEVVTAAQALASRRRELAAFDPKRVGRAEASLGSLGQELLAGRISVRDALISQQALIELLEARLEATRALCVASVDLAVAAGVALERGAP